MSLRLRILGSAAGGGFPQWNCGCQNCLLARNGDSRVERRTQDSVGILGGNGSGWLLINASPDIHRQIENTRELHPRAPRDTPIRALVLTNGDLDHTLGLFSLRESQPLIVYSTLRVWQGLGENAIMRTLERFSGQITHRPLSIDRETNIEELDLAITPFAAPGKLPVHLSDRESSPEDNIGLKIEGGNKRVVYATAVKNVSSIASKLASDVVLLDGTFWSSDELVTPGLSTSRAEDMAHHPLGGPSGSLEMLSAHPSLGRKILTHINNTNPILRIDSIERTDVNQLGWEVATDGMEIVL